MVEALIAGELFSRTRKVWRTNDEGQQAVNPVYPIPGGSVAETTIYRDDEHRLSDKISAL